MSRANKHCNVPSHHQPIRVKSQPPQQTHLNYQHSESSFRLQEGAHRISLPLPSPFQASSSSVFKPNVEGWLPQRTNVKYLNDFLKKQAIIFRHKERVLVRLQKKSQQNHMIDQLQGKIVKMLKLQAKAELLNSSAENSPRKPEEIVSLPIPNAEALVLRHKIPNYKRQPLVGKGSPDEKRAIKQPRKEMLPLLNRLHRNRQTPCFLRKSIKKSSQNIPQSRLSLDTQIHQESLSIKVSSLKDMKPKLSSIRNSTPTHS